MNKYINPLRRAVSGMVLFAFLTGQIFTPSVVQAQVLANLPSPGQGIGLTLGFQPPVLRGMTVHPENPLLFDFIVDRGEEKLNNDLLKVESEKLIKYFLASMTIPDKDAWVNLSPYEADRIVPDALSQTEMGRVMLEQDYILKQLAASLTNPDQELGRKYWNEVRARAQKQFGTTEIPLSTFNKVWIMPDTATVVEKDGFAYITESKLKVMLDEDLDHQKARSESSAPAEHEDLPNQKGRSESFVSAKDEDYVALANQKASVESSASAEDEALDNQQKGTAPVVPLTTKDKVATFSTQVFREIILPKLIEEVNTGKNFAQTRQVYQSVILAAWYKKALKDSLLGRIYADKSKVAGVETDVKDIKQKVYEQYLEAFKKGAYNVIKEEDNGEELIPRKYFSGGNIMAASSVLKIEDSSFAVARAASAIEETGSRLALVAASTVEQGTGEAEAVAGSPAASVADKGVITPFSNSIPNNLDDLLFPGSGVTYQAALDFAESQRYKGYFRKGEQRTFYTMAIDKYLLALMKKPGDGVALEGAVRVYLILGQPEAAALLLAKESLSQPSSVSIEVKRKLEDLIAQARKQGGVLEEDSGEFLRLTQAVLLRGSLEQMIFSQGQEVQIGNQIFVVERVVHNAQSVLRDDRFQYYALGAEVGTGRQVVLREIAKTERFEELKLIQTLGLKRAEEIVALGNDSSGNYVIVTAFLPGTMKELVKDKDHAELAKELPSILENIIALGEDMLTLAAHNKEHGDIQFMNVRMMESGEWRLIDFGDSHGINEAAGLASILFAATTGNLLLNNLWAIDEPTPGGWAIINAMRPRGIYSDSFNLYLSQELNQLIADGLERHKSLSQFVAELRKMRAAGNLTTLQPGTTGPLFKSVFAASSGVEKRLSQLPSGFYNPERLNWRDFRILSNAGIVGGIFTNRGFWDQGIIVKVITPDKPGHAESRERFFRNEVTILHKLKGLQGVPGLLEYGEFDLPGTENRLQGALGFEVFSRPEGDAGVMSAEKSLGGEFRMKLFNEKAGGFDIKYLLEPDYWLAQAKRAARLSIRLVNGNIVSFKDFRRVPDDAARYMKLQGSLKSAYSLDDSLAYQQADFWQRLDGFIKIAGILEGVHQREVVHNDIRGKNIIVAVEEDGSLKYEVIDFSHALLAGEAGDFYKYMDFYYKSHRFSFAGDVAGLGILMWNKLQEATVQASDNFESWTKTGLMDLLFDMIYPDEGRELTMNDVVVRLKSVQGPQSQSETLPIHTERVKQLSSFLPMRKEMPTWKRSFVKEDHLRELIKEIRSRDRFLGQIIQRVFSYQNADSWQADYKMTQDQIPQLKAKLQTFGWQIDYDNKTGFSLKAASGAVLVVEDSKTYRTFIKRELLRAGYPEQDIYFAVSVQEALDLVSNLSRDERMRIGVVVSDYNLGDGDKGTDFLRQVRPLISPGIPLVLFTGEPYNLEKQEWKEFHVIDKESQPTDDRPVGGVGELVNYIMDKNPIYSVQGESNRGLILDGSSPVNPGGIDFDSSKLNLQIKRDGRGVPLPLSQQDLENININGLYPVIINILPINTQTLPILGQINVTPDKALSNQTTGRQRAVEFDPGAPAAAQNGSVKSPFFVRTGFALMNVSLSKG